jgi:hypothetical protein
MAISHYIANGVPEYQVNVAVFHDIANGKPEYQDKYGCFLLYRQW